MKKEYNTVEEFLKAFIVNVKHSNLQFLKEELLNFRKLISERRYSRPQYKHEYGRLAELVDRYIENLEDNNRISNEFFNIYEDVIGE